MKRYLSGKQYLCILIRIGHDFFKLCSILLFISRPLFILCGMATVFLTNFIRCRTSFRMLFRLSL
ncbi:hypothetical protein EWU45_09470, partial [Enterococcus faecium]